MRMPLAIRIFAPGRAYWRSAVCGLALAMVTTGWGQILKVDLGMATGRNDTAASGWVEWQVPDGRIAERDFGGIRVALRALVVDDAMQGVWHKAGLATGAVMATDGVTGRGLEVSISGLEPGDHTLATWHNAVQAMPLGILHLEAESGGRAELLPSHRSPTDAGAAVAYIPFTVRQGEDARFFLKASVDAGVSPVILNGLEIDGSDPTRRVANPFPRAMDAHVDGDSGEVILRWEGTPSSVSYQVYFARASDVEAAEAVIGRAGPGDAAQIAAVLDPMQAVKVDAFNSELVYAWRVDSIDAAGSVTRGPIWSFRVRQVAFPGAEGYGRFAIGGRGGKVYAVTTLADSGPGSLREAVEAEGPRTVVFNVSGRIRLKDRLVVRHPYLTVAGHTAPGSGICLSDYNFGMMGTHDIIIRHLRVRPGDTSGRTLDGMGMASTDHAIIDHCSISWTQDEAFSSRGAGNITLQRTLISEALNIAGHKKYAAGTQHGYAASIGGDIGSFHYNLLAHCAGRNWSLAGGLDKAGVHAGRLDIRNNVVYNWSHRTTDGGAKEVNFVNNYYKPGPASRVFHVLKPERNPGFGPQAYFVQGNVMEGHYGSSQPLEGVVRAGSEPLEAYIVAEPFFPSHVTTVTAEAAYVSVLADVGATIPSQDAHDRRVIDEVRTGSARYSGSVSGLPGLPDSQSDVGGWESYPVFRRPADWDSDGDGLPGIWERAFGLDPQDPTDGPVDGDGDGYTNLEAYLHWLADGNRLETLTEAAIQIHVGESHELLR